MNPMQLHKLFIDFNKSKWNANDNDFCSSVVKGLRQNFNIGPDWLRISICINPAQVFVVLL
jgi:hypothetical protein